MVWLNLAAWGFTNLLSDCGKTASLVAYLRGEKKGARPINMRCEPTDIPTIHEDNHHNFGFLFLNMPRL
jgi:hypothetical protein